MTLSRGEGARHEPTRLTHHNRWRSFWLVVSAVEARYNKKSAEALSL